MKAMDRDSGFKSIVLYDGFCNLCSNTVLFFLKLDRKKKFEFIALQSADGQDMLKRIQNKGSGIDSVMLYKGDQVYYKSKAIFEIVRENGGILKLLLVFSILPDKFTDYLYDLVARNRYLIFGKRKECFIIKR
jgi:predicted DCC family thiol-disulfide oxidoreductase YuxK